MILPSTDTVVTAEFSTWYSLSMSADIGGTVSPASGWYRQGQPIPITATALPSYEFGGWSGTGAGSYSGPNNPAAIVMLGPIAETGLFVRRIPAPSLTGIPDGAQGVPTDPVLSWRPYQGATAYCLEVSTDSLFADTALALLRAEALADTFYACVELPNFTTIHWRVQAILGTEKTPFSAARAFTTLHATIAVASPSRPWAATYTYPISWSTAQLSGTVDLHVSLDSGKSFHMFAEKQANTGTARWTVPPLDHAVDSCRLRVVSHLNTAIYGESGPFSLVPGSLPANVPLSARVRFPALPTSSTAYRLFSLPGSLGTETMASYAMGTPGTDWRMFSDNGNPNDYLEDVPPTAPLKTGRGYWLIKKGDLNIPTYVMAMPPLTSDAMLSIPIHAGWNIIGAPFDKSVPWQGVLEANGLPGTTQLMGYSGAYVSSGSLEPFAGYYFFNGSLRDSLMIPYPFGAAAPRSAPPELGWKMRLTFESDVNADAENFIGISPMSRDSLDDLDGRKAPLLQGQGFLYFSRPGWDARYPRFNSDVRPSLGRGQVWDFDVSNPRTASSGILFEGVDDIPREYSVILLNMLNSIPVDLRTRSRYSYTTVSDIMHFKVIVGTRDFVEGEVSRSLPTSYGLMQNFPNPFNGSTTICMTLSRPADVRLAVFNTLGQQIRVLAEGQYPQGIHTFLWDGTDTRGFPVATGAYFCRLVAGDNPVLVQKMMFSK